MISLLDDTNYCPLGEHCAVCGERDELAVSTFDTPVGVYCATVCTPCVDAGRYPAPESWTAGIDAVWAHCGHLGLTVDEAADLRERERRAD